MTLGSMISDTQERRKRDAERYANLPEDTCQLCGAQGEDKRNLLLRCLYAIHEVLPEAIQLWDVPDIGQERDFYFLRICKSCRGRFLDMLQAWRKECMEMRDVLKDHDGEPLERDAERNIPVRVNGRIVWMDFEEYDAWRAQR